MRCNRTHRLPPPTSFRRGHSGPLGKSIQLLACYGIFEGHKLSQSDGTQDYSTTEDTESSSKIMSEDGGILHFTTVFCRQRTNHLFETVHVQLKSVANFNLFVFKL